MMGNHQFIQQLNPLKYKTRKQEKYDEGHGQVGNGNRANWENGHVRNGELRIQRSGKRQRGMGTSTLVHVAI
jgi:hypothetical protein